MAITKEDFDANFSPLECDTCGTRNELYKYEYSKSTYCRKCANDMMSIW